jgi:hypothetical protein
MFFLSLIKQLRLKKKPKNSGGTNTLFPCLLEALFAKPWWTAVTYGKTCYHQVWRETSNVSPETLHNPQEVVKVPQEVG